MPPKGPKLPTAAEAAAGNKATEEQQRQAAKLLQSPEFMKMFQVAMGIGPSGEGVEDNLPPPEGDPKREQWLKNMQQKLHEQAQAEMKQRLEQVQTDEDGTAWMLILPETKHGFCIKTKLISGEHAGRKVFINICHHSRIAEPEPMAAHEYEGDLDMKDSFKYRIPLSCGACRLDTDKGGQPCHVYDVVVNPATLVRCADDREFRRFVCAIAMHWVSQKHEKHLNADEFTNMNFKTKGSPDVQRIHARTAAAASPNAMNNDIKLPGSSNGPTVPQFQSSSKKTGPLVMEVDPADVERMNAKKRNQQEQGAGAAAGGAAGAPSSPSASTQHGENGSTKPTFVVNKVGNYDWSTHPKPTKNPYFHETVPAEFGVEVQLTDKTASIKEVDVRIGAKNKSVELRWIDEVDENEDCEPFLTVPLPCPIDDTPTSAKFSKKTRVLSLGLRVALPDEVEMEQRAAAAHKAEQEAEAAADGAKRSAEQKALDERRAKFERMQKEEASVMQQRKDLVENLRAVQEGSVPPALREEIDSIPKEQAQIMLARLESKRRNNDAIDKLLDMLSDDALYATTVALRDKLGLEQLKRPDPPAKKEATPPVAAEDGGVDVSEDHREYNLANKCENLFGVKMYNRYVFALDH